jgi:cell division protein FtsQ
MPRKEPAEKPARWRWVRTSARVMLAGGIIGGGLYAFQKVELFLLRDPRFVIAIPDFGLESPSLKIQGVHYASRSQVLRVFAPEFGRSLYQVPLKERRARLLQLDWVRDASVSRIWPNQLLIRVKEREPVAFIQVPAPGGISRFSLIDADGVVLQPPKQAVFKLPLVLGIKPEEQAYQRRDGVHRMTRLFEELGPLAARISEVDVGDPDNLKVGTKVDNRAITLLLGDRNFSQRMQNFQTHYPQIQQKLPSATTLDLRLEDRITAVEGNE